MQAQPELIGETTSAPDMCASLRGPFLLSLTCKSDRRGVTGVAATLAGDDIPTRAARRRSTWAESWYFS